jgi:hypothetical protein
LKENKICKKRKTENKSANRLQRRTSWSLVCKSTKSAGIVAIPLDEEDTVVGLTERTRVALIIFQQDEGVKKEQKFNQFVIIIKIIIAAAAPTKNKSVIQRFWFNCGSCSHCYVLSNKKKGWPWPKQQAAQQENDCEWSTVIHFYQQVWR